MDIFGVWRSVFLVRYYLGSNNTEQGTSNNELRRRPSTFNY